MHLSSSKSNHWHIAAIHPVPDTAQSTMAESGNNSRSPDQIFTSADRIRQLNEIDKVSKLPTLWRSESCDNVHPTRR